MNQTAMRSAASAERRSARRAVIRSLHPDRGGDPDELIEALRALDPSLDRVPGLAPVNDAANRVTVTFAVTTSRRRTAAWRGRALVRQARSRLPRRWPGALRYGYL